MFAQTDSQFLDGLFGGGGPKFSKTRKCAVGSTHIKIINKDKLNIKNGGHSQGNTKRQRSGNGHSGGHLMQTPFGIMDINTMYGGHNPLEWYGMGNMENFFGSGE